ncbi:glycosyltransferase family 2 protein [Nodosilinea sp. PGN35]|uniref:glycosyltransferase family 2 protein n=1 Tax=Nodosilinea sp. PGN35 TaxID=3020489 RepID=UPI0023B2DBBA|nr:glycosyltransferase family 2 protein [Nodosilinea sp. TSF1-S3]MDF0368157.1 glycosyltransferase family 2 protein [Nodosilinea sp. TSF1-S3]
MQESYSAFISKNSPELLANNPDWLGGVSQSLPACMPDGSAWPRISIVTPSYNQGQFIEQTIQSVIAQKYPNLEYFIIDGGSTDDSVEIIRKYSNCITGWVSQKDQGAWDAILKGSKMCTGKWFNWLNSDDLLMPNSLINFAKIASSYQTYKWISGCRIDINEEGSYVRSTCPWVRSHGLLAFGQGFFPQDATFIQLEEFNYAAEKIPKELKNIFDTALHNILLVRSKPLLTTTVFSAMRWHSQQLTSNNVVRLQEYELLTLLKITPKMNWQQKVLHRLSQTRFHESVIQIIRLLLSFNLLKADDFDALVYVPWTREYELKSARKAYLSDNF